MTSSIAAQASASAPSGRLSIRRSVRMRASTGNAVIDIATPMNSANAVKPSVGRDEAVDGHREREPERQRERDAGVRDAAAWRRGPAGRGVELEPDQEHVEDQPEVGRRPRGTGARPVGNTRRLEVGQKRAEERRAEQDPGDHLAHHPRLADADREQAHEPRHQHHHHHRQEEAASSFGNSRIFWADTFSVAGAPSGGCERVVVRVISRLEAAPTSSASRRRRRRWRCP